MQNPRGCAGLRLGLWLASLGDKAPEVLSTLMTLLAKGIIKPHSGAASTSQPCPDPHVISFVCVHQLLEANWRCFLTLLALRLLCMQACGIL